jgi:hypothetical protein
VPVRSAVATIVLALLPVLAGGGLVACGGDDDGDGAPEPTPQPTVDDPGPNDTTGGPQTVQGTLQIDAATGCTALDTEAGRLALSFDGYSVGDAGGPVLVADDDGRTVARAGDTVVVSGFPGDGPGDPCGRPFTVDSFNSVIP